MDDAPDSTAAAATARAGGRGDEVALGVLGHYVGFHLRLAQNASFKAFKRHTGESELRPGWFAVMMLISRNPGITPMALSRASGRDKSTITPVLRALEQRGLINRCPLPGDRRSHTLTLTAAGEQMLDRLATHAAAHDAALDRIVGDRKNELLDLLRRITAEID